MLLLLAVGVVLAHVLVLVLVVPCYGNYHTSCESLNFVIPLLIVVVVLLLVAAVVVMTAIIVVLFFLSSCLVVVIVIVVSVIVIVIVLRYRCLLHA